MPKASSKKQTKSKKKSNLDNLTEENIQKMGSDSENEIMYSLKKTKTEDYNEALKKI